MAKISCGICDLKGTKAAGAVSLGVFSLEGMTKGKGRKGFRSIKMTGAVLVRQTERIFTL